MRPVTIGNVQTGTRPSRRAFPPHLISSDLAALYKAWSVVSRPESADFPATLAAVFLRSIGLSPEYALPAGGTVAAARKTSAAELFHPAARPVEGICVGLHPRTRPGKKTSFTTGPTPTCRSRMARLPGCKRGAPAEPPTPHQIQDTRRRCRVDRVVPGAHGHRRFARQSCR